jgi:hypothetical protein
MISKRSVITRNYRRLSSRVVLIIVLSAAAPSVLFINAVDKPLVVISPSNPYVTLPAPGANITQAASVRSVYADSWSIHLTAATFGQLGQTLLLTTYINNTLGPFEIPFLQRGHELPISLRIISSPRTYNGTYSLVLSYKYQDLIGHEYSGSFTMGVGVGVTELAPLPILSYSVLGFVGFLVVVLVALVLRRVQSPRRKL